VTGVSPAVGLTSGNYTITIAGTNLASVTAVSFGAEPAADVAEVPPAVVTVTSTVPAA
jgi:hypothetical protein